MLLMWKLMPAIPKALERVNNCKNEMLQTRKFFFKKDSLKRMSHKSNFTRLRKDIYAITQQFISRLYSFVYGNRSCSLENWPECGRLHS